MSIAVLTHLKTEFDHRKMAAPVIGQKKPNLFEFIKGIFTFNCNFCKLKSNRVDIANDALAVDNNNENNSKDTPTKVRLIIAFVTIFGLCSSLIHVGATQEMNSVQRRILMISFQIVIMSIIIPIIIIKRNDNMTNFAVQFIKSINTKYFY